MSKSKRNKRGPGLPTTNLQTSHNGSDAGAWGACPEVQGGALVFVALNRASGLKFVMPDGRRVEIAGNAAHLKGLEKGKLPIGAFGLTPVAADDWEYIKETYGALALFKNGLIFAAERKDYALDEAEEKSELRHGLEPVAPEDMKTTPAAAAE